MTLSTSAPAPASTPTAATRGGLWIWVQFLAMGLVWGASFLFMAVALDGVSFGQIAWSRIILGALALGLIVLVTRPRRADAAPDAPLLPREPIVWVHFTVVAFSSCVVPFLCFAWAQQYVSSSLASIYNATTPIMTALIATLGFRVERLSATRWVGVVVGILGVVVIIAPWQVAALSGSVAGQLACLVATACYGFTFGYQRRFLTGRPIAPAVFSFGYIGVAAVIMLLLTPIVAWQPVDLDWRVIASLVALGVFGTGVVYIWYVNVLRAWGPTNTSTVTYVTPVVGVALGLLVLGERFSWHEPAGAVLVLVGILLTQGRLRLRSRRAAVPAA